MTEPTTELVEAVARAISGAPFPSPASMAKARKAILAIDEVRARQAGDRIAWLQANIAQMDAFLKRPEEADPIGHVQWSSRKADFERQLEEAKAAGTPVVTGG